VAKALQSGDRSARDEHSPAGDALTVPAGAVHAVRNVGSGTGSVLATDVVEKGKPLLTLAE
jgi:quercetin dioxygenase-like cupin family protein